MFSFSENVYSCQQSEVHLNRTSLVLLAAWLFSALMHFYQAVVLYQCASIIINGDQQSYFPISVHLLIFFSLHAGKSKRIRQQRNKNKYVRRSLDDINPLPLDFAICLCFNPDNSSHSTCGCCIQFGDGASRSLSWQHKREEIVFNANGSKRIPLHMCLCVVTDMKKLVETTML